MAPNVDWENSQGGRRDSLPSLSQRDAVVKHAALGEQKPKQEA